ncbi:unnamed protein product, partial [Rotaria sp. Silwood1]
FGSTAYHVITATGVHYDCGCVINYDGALVQFTNRTHPNPLNPPAVYVAYFSTFGALAWHLLLFDESVANLYGPILAKHAIDYDKNDGKIVGRNLRTKTLAEHKKYVNSLQLESQLQTNLQDYITRMPIIIRFLHFKTELGNPNHSKMPLNILRNFLNSTDFLKMTKIIYDLSQFYILLHYTYAQLIERDEFSEITLRVLYERGQKRFNTTYNFDNRNECNNHMLIIENGIKAVNLYHKFTDGLIQPGACDATQRFFTIGHDTLVSYLVTTGNNDEGDIIMRIL